VGSETMHFF